MSLKIYWLFCCCVGGCWCFDVVSLVLFILLNLIFGVLQWCFNMSTLDSSVIVLSCYSFELSEDAFLGEEGTRIIMIPQFIDIYKTITAWDGTLKPLK